ncbi:tyrosine-type recombinase/integrase [Streptomyces sp. NPDC005388]|uniref:tyrosine-type recombinase/integrase n=1 Tax=Streptomyces sp. NPDC005388 TaxID=3156717 RepID=UPI00339F2502
MTSPAPIIADPVSPVVPLDLASWTGWLQEQVDPLWRPGEWAQEAWFFDGDLDHPRTRVDKCRTTSCWTLMPARRGFCRHCSEVHRNSGLSREEFAATYQRPRRIRLERGAERDACVLERDSMRCERPIYTQDLCRTHYTSYRRRFSQTMSLEEWVASGDTQPLQARPTCIVRGCPNQRVLNTFCNPHYQSWERDRRQGVETGDPEAWASRVASNLRSNQFCLRPLEEAVRWEVLYGLQQRDARGGALEPAATRLLVSRLGGIPSLLTVEPEDFAARMLRGNNIVAQFREFARSIRLASLSFRGMSPTDADLWDLPSLGLKSAGLGGRRQRHGHVDASAIRQPWLREVLKTWAETVSMKNDKFKRTFNACVVASDALHTRPGGGKDVTRLRFADVQAVFSAMSCIRRSDNGELASRKWRMDSFSVFLDLIDFGRKTDMLDGLPGSFNRDKTLVLPHEETIEDAAGKAVPEPVIDQMDAHLHLMGAGFPYGEMERADIELMLQTAYLVLRDTGRRPIEVASLRLKCLETRKGENTLLWDNVKKRRYGRKLPITRETADVIRTWQGRRRQIEVPSRSRKYLFPSITDRSGFAHMEASSLANSMREWVAAIPVLLSDELDEHGARMPFDRTLIFPYAFRHAYAQRHADAGIPVDVLKELMDHRSIVTTMSYYQVSLKRKREAITTMRRHTIDRSGRPAPFTSTTDYEAQSVAVPFGNCREPSNVKAGGKACAIRFQCAGCGFYRPDPSYMPAIEQHVNDLRADLETAKAMDADDFVARNLTDQITAFTNVAGTMRDRLSSLPEAEREEIEEASAVLRKVRATRDHTLLPLTVIRKGTPDAG